MYSLLVVLLAYGNTPIPFLYKGPIEAQCFPQKADARSPPHLRVASSLLLCFPSVSPKPAVLLRPHEWQVHSFAMEKREKENPYEYKILLFVFRHLLYPERQIYSHQNSVFPHSLYCISPQQDSYQESKTDSPSR